MKKTQRVVFSFVAISLIVFVVGHALWVESIDPALGITPEPATLVVLALGMLPVLIGLIGKTKKFIKQARDAQKSLARLKAIVG